MKPQHDYKLTVKWTGNKGTGTSNYRAYERSHSINIEGKAELLGSSDPAFRGDKSRHNPEDLLVASISTCHMLWYLHLCADAGIVVMDYTDHATGILQETEDGSGHFSEITLNPIVIITDSSMIDKANELHTNANKMCFIANSVNFPIHHKPICKTENA